MRVLHLTDRWSDRGGAYVHLQGIVEEQRKAGHTLRVAAADLEGQPPACPELSVVAGLEARGEDPAPLLALDALVAAERPDLVHVHTVMNPRVLEWAGARPALITVQDHRLFCPGRGKLRLDGRVCVEAMSPTTCAPCFEDQAYFRHILGLTERRLRALRSLRRVVVLSEYMQRELVAVGVPEQQVDVVPPFVHDLRDCPANGPPCVLFVGRLVSAKGPLEAVAAWRASEVRLPLVVAGTGPLREAVAAAGAEVLGWVGRAELARLYARARAVLLTSRWQEPFGIVGLEARSLGVPVVAWDSGGVREWSPSALVPWGDVEGLARELNRALAGGAAPKVADERAVRMRQLSDVYGRAAGSRG
ncbi:MAG: glycosyltransferase family 4 protein [Vicinamibacteria bacterium]